MEKISVKEIVTQKIIAKIESGELLKWESAFKYFKRNIKSDHDYSFLNQFLLSGDTSEFYLSAKQCIALHLDFKGTKFNHFVTFWKIMKSIDKETGKEKTIPLLRYFRVTGLDTLPESEGKTKLIDKLYQSKNERNIDIDTFIEKSGVKMEMGGNGRASYSPMLDRISLPKMEVAKSSKRYYKTLLHELVHSTGHKSRLNRGIENGFGTENYSKEELVAEIGSAMLCNYFGIADDETDDNASAYCKNWLSYLHNDINMIISASSQADKAVKYLLGMSEDGEEETADEE